MKKVLLFTLSTVVFFPALQQESKARTGPLEVKRATGSAGEKGGPIKEPGLRAASAKALKLVAADLKAKNKQGLTALDLAKNYNHSIAAGLLTSKIASR
ncbi:MAG TPA: hypothetical protein VKC34_01295 [Blastocatellia bacterium]|nr:hypothetical protein [Blastocatellia bacterium]